MWNSQEMKKCQECTCSYTKHTSSLRLNVFICVNHIKRPSTKS
jgi:hypothetical protein